MIPEIKKILCATDLSENAYEAIRYAFSIADKYGAHLTTLHVIPNVFDTLALSAGVNFGTAVKEIDWEKLQQDGLNAARISTQKRLEEIFNELKKQVPHSSLELDDIVVEVGNPVEHIISVAEKGNYDLVVLGTHGHSKFSDILLGSVATGVVRKCAKPVMVVRLPEEKSA